MKEGIDLENTLLKLSFEQRGYYHKACSIKEVMALYDGHMTDKMLQDYQLVDMSINLCHEGHDPEIIVDAVSKSYPSYQLIKDISGA